MKKEKLTHIIEAELPHKYMENEDGGQFKGFNVSKVEGEENGIYVKICSWDDDMEHSEFEKFINRKVKITIETID
jgi:hypothetical protein